jgi:hypothetical protein
MGNNHLYLEPKSSIIRLSKITQNGAMLQASAVVSQYYLGVSTMNDYTQLPLPFPHEVTRISIIKKGKGAGKYEVLVSTIDVELTQITWTIKILSDNIQYATKNIKIDGKWITIQLHREVMERVLGRELEKHEQVDHINGNGLDNRRENLRIATAQQNQWNRGKSSNNSSGYKGVYWHRYEHYWYAQIHVEGKRIHLGIFQNAKDASDVYNKKAAELRGEYNKE